MAGPEIRPGTVAVVGFAGRFPRAGSVTDFWRRLREGVECISFFSDEELRADGVPPEHLADPSYVKAYGWLDGIELFDAGFFDVSPREAELLDPQQRLFLECAWEALEDAGHDAARFPGSIGVFAGSGRNHYFLEHVLPDGRALAALGPVAAMLGNEKDFLATRTAYKLDLSGPSVSVQTACSTSLVAVHLACQSLLDLECDLVLAGGVSITHPTKVGYPYVDDGFFSPDGHLRAFDARAAGQIGGNGAAVVVLRRLEDALADGDSIRAILIGTAINNDGQRKVSFNAPGVEGQGAVIAEALEVAGVDPRTIGYVECHGTGTHLGDPIEIAALVDAFRGRTRERGFCAVGSLKTNFGHLDAAAGVSGLIKAALALQQREIPPSLNFERPNPEIDFAASPFFVNTALRPWPRGDVPRRAGVSAFGMGGTNAHAILEEAPEQHSDAPARAWQVLCLSARSEKALESAVQRLSSHLSSPAGRMQQLADVAHTLSVGRRAFRHRRAVVARDHEQALSALGGDRRRSASGVAGTSARPVAFLFSGQGSQYPGMTRGLYETEPVFRREVDRACALFTPLVGRDLRELLYPAQASEAAEKELSRTEHTQPALFVVEWALAKLLAESGVEPAAMLGHSVGEYVAACEAGVFTLEEAASLVAARGRLIGSLPSGGAMLAVQLSEGELARELSGSLSIAAVNAPGLCVVSGKEQELAALESKLSKREVTTRKLITSHAFHSSLMDPVLGAFESEVRKVRLRAPEKRVVSCTTGRWLSAEEARDPGYWVRHLRQPVRFAEGVKTLLGEGEAALLEVGPGQALSTLAKLTAGTGADARVVTTTRHPQEESKDEAVFALSLGKLWALGVEVDWEARRGTEKRLRVPLPTYPFERKRYWIEKPRGTAAGASVEAPAPAAALPERKEPDLARWFSVPTWRRSAFPAARPDAQGSWLLFVDGCGLAQALAARIESSGGRAILVRSGARFAAAADGSFTIDPLSGADHEALLRELARDARFPREILHLGGVEPAPTEARALDELAERSYFELFHLARALGSHAQSEGVRIQVVTSGLFDVLDERVVPEKACLLGVVKAIRAEFAGLSCRAIDVEEGLLRVLQGDDRLELLVQELTSRASEPCVAHRAGRRWLPDVEPVELGPASVPRLREEAVVLVTGGLGGVGLSLARGLAREARARLVLVGRRALPERARWDAWIAEHGAQDATSRRIARVRELEALGARVALESADVADEAAMTRVVSEARRLFGPIQGVVHAAGAPGGGVLALRTPEASRAVLAPKVRGTRVLERVLSGEPLDFFVLCSSLASALDGVGQADYFAANAFLDAYAVARRREARPLVRSIGWETWRDVGMAVETEVPEALRRRREESLRLGLSEDEGWEVFRRVLAAPHAHVLVSTRDLARREVEERAALRGAGATAEAAGPEARAPETEARHPRPALSTEYVAPRTLLESSLATLLGELLGVDRVGVRDNFLELGGNSLLLMQVSTRLRSEHGATLSMRQLFETPDLGSLAERIESMRLVARVGRATAEVGSAETEEFRL